MAHQLQRLSYLTDDLVWILVPTSILAYNSLKIWFQYMSSSCIYRHANTFQAHTHNDNKIISKTLNIYKINFFNKKKIVFTQNN